MRTRRVLSGAKVAGFGALCSVVAGCASSGPRVVEWHAAAQPAGQVAPLLDGLGSHTHRVTTTVPRAQRFFDQGLNLTYAFNHKEAIRSFRESARLDPQCAMAYWGWALALGSNINSPIDAERAEKAYTAIQTAMSLRSNATAVEAACIEALAKRYSQEARPDRAALNKAYADAMGLVVRRFPDDQDVATFYAAALMNLQPWSYWTRDGKPKGDTPTIVATLESVLDRNPHHPGALHYYIHATEASNTPERAESAADRLRYLMPGAGHLLHMPSHTFMRVGRYADASECNVAGIAADERYITQCRAQGIYPLIYYPHNIHFLWAAASMEGRNAVAIEAARKVASKVSPEMLREETTLQTFVVAPLYAMTRFGRWDEALREPKPDGDLPFVVGIWHYARGLALASKGRIDEASSELDSLTAIADDPNVAEKPVTLAYTTASAILGIATEVLAGELAAKRGDKEKAIAHLHRAVLLEDGLRYDEPEDWHYPTRHVLGALLLDAGRSREAESVYWEDLKRHPENGWALYGLLESLRAQGDGRKRDAADVETRFRKAWAHADITLTASRF